MKTDAEKAKDIMKILGILEQIRQPYESMIEDIITYVLHGRRKIADKYLLKGGKTGTDCYDGTALGALNLLSDGLHGYLVSPAMRWFSFTLPGKLNFPRFSGMRAWSGKRMDEYPDVKMWLEDSEEVMYAAFQRSNFYEQTPEFFKDGASIGTVTKLCEEDIKSGRINFTVPHFREGYIAENFMGVIDTYYRDMKMTMKQMVEKWGMERMKELDPVFDRKFESDPYTELELVRAIYPRTDFEPEKINKENMPWASTWLIKGEKKLIEDSGFEYKPFNTWRWRKNSDEWYGRSPAWDAFVEVMLSHQMGKSNIIAGHKMVNPPLVGPEDMRGKVQRGPGAYTSIGNLDWEKKMPKQLQEKIELPFSIEFQDRLDAKIKEYFHVDFFLMLSQAAFQKIDITATQVIEMQGEKAAILGTRIGRIQTDDLNPTIDQVFFIERRAGRIPDPPQILLDYAGDKNIEVDYQGPLAQAQKRLFKSQSINAGLTRITNFATSLAAISPEKALEVLDPIDIDETVTEILETSGYPAKAMKTEEEIRAIREGRAKKAAMAEFGVQASEAAKAIPGLSKAIEPNSPMDMITGGQMQGNA